MVFFKSLFPSLLGLLIFEIVNGFYLYFIPSSGPFRQYNVLFHTFAGLLLILPFIIYQIDHWKTNRDYRKSSLKLLSGYLLMIFLCGSVGTGLVITLFGRQIGSLWIYLFHVVVSGLVVLLLLGHIIFKFGIKTYENSGPILRSSVQRRDWIICFVVLALLGGGVFGLEHVTHLSLAKVKDLGNNYKYPYGENPFWPSEGMSVGQTFIEAGELANSRSCGVNGCHQDIYDQWMSSMHKKAASDVFYKRNIEYLVEKKGMEITRYCGACHEPVALFSGEMTSGGSLDITENSEGVSCVVCHSIAQIRHLDGVGSYLLQKPERYLFAKRNHGPLQTLNHFLIRSDPDAHNETFMKPFYSTSEYCGTCHTQYIDKDVNHWGWIKMQDQYGGWLASPYSGRNTKSGYNQAEERTCMDCHMPLVEGKDPSRSDNLVHSHRFAASNTAIAWLDGDHEQYEQIESFLKKHKVVIDIYEPREKGAKRSKRFIENKLLPSEESSSYVTLGDEVEISAAITNIGVGHNFPEGVLDIYQAWVEFKVVDSQNQIVYWSGKVDENGFVDPDARIYHTLAVDRTGRHLYRHDLWNMVGNVYSRAIAAGHSDIVTYRFKVPYWVKGNLCIMARLRHRKFNQSYTNFIMRDESVRLPIIDMARDTLDIAVKKHHDVEKAY